ncbi:MAG: hypothetical protein ACI9OJ_003921 [Myxococcota bacterium]|jgi:hypothetical protein
MRFALIVLLLTGCATPRFKDQAIVWRVDDARAIPEPAEREFLVKRYMADVFVLRRIPRAMELRPTRPAANTNALDDVPDSTWFQNRIGVRPMAPAEAATGSSHSPPILPLVVTRGKTLGGNPGFFAVDASGRTFLIKFDTLANPELQTSASVIVNRFFWAIGFNVPSDHVVTIDPAEVRIQPYATVVDDAGYKRLLTVDDLQRILATAPRRADGLIRASASEFLDGIPKGGFPPEGRRLDDPNDTVNHEDRRELRGLYVFSSWLGHTDVKEDNTLDMYVTEGGRSFLKHYLLDFGEALGGHRAEKRRMEDGYEHFWDWGAQTGALFSLGLWKRRWEDLKETRWPSIGSFTAKYFDPKNWREAYPYWPFFERTDADGYWAAKIIMRFDRPIVEAIVREGRLTDPLAQTYLVDTLMARRELIGAAWFETVSPLDNPHFNGEQLCLVDLSMRYRLATQGALEVLGADNKLVSRHTIDLDGRVCFDAVRPEYTVWRLRVVRGRHKRPVVQFHTLANRVLGVVRVEQ